MDLVPERIGKWLVGPGRGILVLESDEEVLRLKLLDDTRKELASTQIRASDYSSASIDDFLQSHGFTRDGVDIGIRLSSEKIFARKLTLPGEARGSIDEIVAEDLTRKTPFRLNDVYHGIAVRQVEGADKLSVWQWVTRRKFVEDDVAPFAIDPESVAFADSVVRDEVNSPFPFIPLRPHASTRMSLLQKSALALGCSAVFLALLAGGLKYSQQQEAMDDLDARIAAARPKAQQVRSAVEKIEKNRSTLARIRLQKSEMPGLLDVWEETTRVLPSHSWLTELRLTEVPEKNDQLVAMTGFSAEVTNLVGLIDRSPMFADASLTSPVALDPIEGRERFALQAKLRKSGPFKEAAR